AVATRARAATSEATPIWAHSRLPFAGNDGASPNTARSCFLTTSPFPPRPRPCRSAAKNRPSRNRLSRFRHWLHPAHRQPKGLAALSFSASEPGDCTRDRENCPNFDYLALIAPRGPL